MRSKIACLLVLFVASLPRITEAAVLRSYPAKGSRVQQGYFYSLPKTAITGTAKYNVYKIIYFSNEEKTDVIKRSYAAFIDDPIVLEYPAVRDDNARFRIDAKRLRSFTVATKSDVYLDENNLITKVNVDLDDQTGPMIESLVQTGANVAALLAKAGVAASSSDTVKAVEYKLVGTYPQSFSFNIEQDLHDKIADSQEFSNTSVPPEKFVRISKFITDDTVAKNISDMIAKDGGIDLAQKTVLLPRIKLSVTVPKSLFEANQTSKKIEADFNDHWYSKLPLIGNNGSIPGVIVRTPNNCKVDCLMSFYRLPLSGPTNDVDVDDDAAFSGRIQTVVAIPWFNDQFIQTKPRILYGAYKPFLQFGNTSVIPISSGLFTHRVYRLDYSPSGQLKQVGIDTDSRGANIAKTLENSSKAASPIGDLIGSFAAKSAKGAKAK